MALPPKHFIIAKVREAGLNGKPGNLRAQQDCNILAKTISSRLDSVEPTRQGVRKYQKRPSDNISRQSWIAYPAFSAQKHEWQGNSRAKHTPGWHKRNEYAGH